MHGHCPGNGAQRPVDLGALALAVPDVLAPDVRGMGRAHHQQIVLGRLVLSSAESQRLLAPGGCQSVSVQMDPHPVSMLENAHTPYDEARYLKALQDRGSPLLKMAETA